MVETNCFLGRQEPRCCPVSQDRLAGSPYLDKSKTGSTCTGRSWLPNRGFGYRESILAFRSTEQTNTQDL